MNFFLLFVNDPAIPRLNDAFAVGWVLFRMRGLHDGCSFGVQSVEKVHDFFAVTRVKISGRSVSPKEVLDSLSAEGLNRINTCGAARREQTCNQRCRREQKR